MKHPVAVVFVVACVGCGGSTPTTVYEQGSPGAAGTNGSDGTDGLTSLVNVVQLGAGNANCQHGGSEIETGVDANRDGTLEPSEVQGTVYVCNGSNGTNGTNGANGTSGTNGTNGTNGQNGSNGQGLVWVDSNSQIMPFFNVINPNFGTQQSGDLQDPNTQALWQFATRNAQQPLISPLDPNDVNQFYTASAGGTMFYTTSNCGGTAYIAWDFGAYVTTTNAGDTNAYISTTQPVSILFSSSKWTGNNTCVTAAYNVSAVPVASELHVTPPTTMGVPPYHQAWVE